VDTAGCILQGDVRTKVKTPGTGKNVVKRLCKLLHGEAMRTPLYPSPGFMPGPQHLRICPHCKHGHHWANECHLQTNVEGQPFQGKQGNYSWGPSPIKQ
jgi:hypothetical protein